VEPDVQALEPFVREADKRFARARPQLQAVLIAAIAERYRRQPLAATFRIIVSPLVTWIWIGALIVVFGALIAMWPAPAAVRRGEASAYARRLARELA
jgi:cytochrome c-type biogenesis protein CcmF